MLAIALQVGNPGLCRNGDFSQLNQSGTVQTPHPEQGICMSLVESPGNPLKQFGITLDPNALRQLTPQEQLQEHKKNLESYTLEVLADRPVSSLYNYWLDNSHKLYTDLSLQEKYLLDYQLDKRERNGIYFKGINTVGWLTVGYPGKVILWYSPKGPASFDHDPTNPYSAINYDYGQLYIQYYDGEKINAVALKVSDEKLLADQFPVLARTLGIEDERDRIAQCVLKPKVLPFSIDEFFDQEWGEGRIYKDYQIGEVMNEAREVFAGKQFKVILVDDIVERRKEDLSKLPFSVNALFYEQTSRQVLHDYLLTINRYFEVTGKTTLNLSGSCGGSTISEGDINGLLGIKDFIEEMSPMKVMSGYGSLNRRMAQSEQKWDYHDGGPCRDCGKDPAKVGPCNICIDCEKKYD